MSVVLVDMYSNLNFLKDKSTSVYMEEIIISILIAGSAGVGKSGQCSVAVPRSRRELY